MECAINGLQNIHIYLKKNLRRICTRCNRQLRINKQFSRKNSQVRDRFFCASYFVIVRGLVVLVVAVVVRVVRSIISGENKRGRRLNPAEWASVASSNGRRQISWKVSGKFRRENGPDGFRRVFSLISLRKLLDRNGD